ncbi:MAG: lytic murein transglycosylase [Proteobacteria bacterium]|nr:lytic murein transglycosylase [Pseudomonadota bacterium]
MGDRADRVTRGVWRGLALAGLLALGVVAAAGPARADRFADWLNGVRADARAEGIKAQTLDAAFVGVAPLPRIIELDRKQPEFTLTFAEYLDRVVPQARVERARDRLAQRRALLDEVAERYGVAPRFIVALWGVESDFGQQTGGFSVIAALATLAFDGRRSAYFRRELLDALRILDRGDVTPANMKGSWAGAMGQSQFMPSSFLRYAVDHDGDGKRDIWSDGPDLFASIANYLAKSGWHANETWGRAVILPPGFDRSLASLDVAKPASAWTALGVRRADGGELAPNDPAGSVLLPSGGDGPAFLIHDNFRVLLRWNRSNYFATAVGLLADRIE